MATQAIPPEWNSISLNSISLCSKYEARVQVLSESGFQVQPDVLEGIELAYNVKLHSGYRTEEEEKIEFELFGPWYQ